MTYTEVIVARIYKHLADTGRELKKIYIRCESFNKLEKETRGRYNYEWDRSVGYEKISIMGVDIVSYSKYEQIPDIECAVDTTIIMPPSDFVICEQKVKEPIKSLWIKDDE